MEIVKELYIQALPHARAGAGSLFPWDMMDGHIGAISNAVDISGFTEVAVVEYTANYASAYFGPFRDALNSAPRKSWNVPIERR